MKENLINVQMSEEFYNEKFLKMGEGGSGGTMEYLDVSGLSKMDRQAYLEFSFYVKLNMNGSISIALGTMTDIRSATANIVALGIDPNATIITSSLTTTVLGYIEMTGMLDAYNAIPRITKEQFYNLSSEEDSGGLKEGDVLYYRIVTPLNHTGLISNVNSGNLITGITQLAVSSCINENSGNGYFNQFWDSWTLNQNNTIKNDSLVAETINAVKFTVGADNKDLIAVSNSDKDITDSEKYFIQITKEEYDNIFNS